jgi:hypothetical protein
LQSAFRKALGLVGAAVRNGTSHAAYLHGSFGAGKSHFLTVLHAVRIKVSDTRTERKVPAPGDVAAPTADAESGRGLILVEALAQAWGVVPRVVGKTVWALVERPAAVAAEERDGPSRGPGAAEYACLGSPTAGGPVAQPPVASRDGREDQEDDGKRSR